MPSDHSFVYQESCLVKRSWIGMCKNICFCRVLMYGPVTAIPVELPFNEAALAEPLACAINGLKLAQFGFGKSLPSLRRINEAFEFHESRQGLKVAVHPQD